MLKPLPIKLPELLRAKLTTLRAQGYTASGYIRALLERELRDIPPTYPPKPLNIQKATLKSKRIIGEERSTPSETRGKSWHSDGKGGLRR